MGLFDGLAFLNGSVAGSVDFGLLLGIDLVGGWRVDGVCKGLLEGVNVDGN